MKKILYFHGYNGSPHGQRYGLLTSAGYRVEAPELPFARGRAKELSRGLLNPAAWGSVLGLGQAIEQAYECLESNQPDVIVATSLGGAVALCLCKPEIPLVLLAPVWNARVNHGELIKISYGRHRDSQVAQVSSLGGASILGGLLSLQGWPDISSCHAPLLVLHDAQDEVVPIAQTERLIAGYGRPQGGWPALFLDTLHRELDQPSSQVSGCQITIHENQGPHHPIHGPATQKCLLRVLEVLARAN